MKIRRDLASVPQRSAKATWERIIALISTASSTDAAQLRDAASVMEALIAEECPARAPIVVKGSGPRLVIYLKYDRDALEHGDSVEALSWNPTEGDWTLHAPAPAEDLAWMRASLAKSPRVRVYDVSEDLEEVDAPEAAGALDIDWGAVQQ